MSKNNYMGKIDEDYTGTTIPNYDSPKKCRNCKSAIGQDYNNWEKFCDICQKDFCSKCIDNHICGENKMKKEKNPNTKRVLFWLDPKKYFEAKLELMRKGKSFVSWLREKIDELLKTKQ